MIPNSNILMIPIVSYYWNHIVSLLPSVTSLFETSVPGRAGHYLEFDVQGPLIGLDGWLKTDPECFSGASTWNQ